MAVKDPQYGDKLAIAPDDEYIRWHRRYYECETRDLKKI